jgi:hypothetical protein
MRKETKFVTELFETWINEILNSLAENTEQNSPYSDFDQLFHFKSKHYEIAYFKYQFVKNYSIKKLILKSICVKAKETSDLNSIIKILDHLQKLFLLDFRWSSGLFELKNATELTSCYSPCLLDLLPHLTQLKSRIPMRTFLEKLAPAEVSCLVDYYVYLLLCVPFDQISNSLIDIFEFLYELYLTQSTYSLISLAFVINLTGYYDENRDQNRVITNSTYIQMCRLIHDKLISQYSSSFRLSKCRLIIKKALTIFNQHMSETLQPILPVYKNYRNRDRLQTHNEELFKWFDTFLYERDCFMRVSLRISNHYEGLDLDGFVEFQKLMSDNLRYLCMDGLESSVDVKSLIKNLSTPMSEYFRDGLVQWNSNTEQINKDLERIMWRYLIDYSEFYDQTSWSRIIEDVIRMNERKISEWNSVIFELIAKYCHVYSQIHSDIKHAEHVSIMVASYMLSAILKLVNNESFVDVDEFLEIGRLDVVADVIVLIDKCIENIQSFLDYPPNTLTRTLIPILTAIYHLFDSGTALKTNRSMITFNRFYHKVFQVKSNWLRYHSIWPEVYFDFVIRKLDEFFNEKDFYVHEDNELKISTLSLIQAYRCFFFENHKLKVTFPCFFEEIKLKSYKELLDDVCKCFLSEILL